MITAYHLKFNNESELCIELGLSLELCEAISILKNNSRFNEWLALTINQHSTTKKIVVGNTLFDNLSEALEAYGLDNTTTSEANAALNKLSTKHPKLLDSILSCEFHPDAISASPDPGQFSIGERTFENNPETRNAIGLSKNTIKLLEYSQNESSIVDIATAEINHQSSKFLVANHLFDSMDELFDNFQASNKAKHLFKTTPILISGIAEELLMTKSNDTEAITIDFGEITFPSFSALATALNIERKTLAYRLRNKNLNEMTFEQVKQLASPKRIATSPGSLHAITVRGVKYNSESEAARAWGISKQTASARIQKANVINQKVIDEAYTTPPSPYLRPTEVNGTIYSNLEELAKGMDIDLRALQTLCIAKKAKTSIERATIALQLQRQ